MRDIVDKYINAEEITAIFVNEAPLVFPLEQFFPSKIQAGTKITYLKGASGKGVVLRASTYEDEAIMRGRLSATLKEEEMPYFKEALPLHMSEMQELNKMQNLASDNDLLVKTVDGMYDDRYNLIRGAYTRAEELRSMVIQGENISINDNGVIKTVDYGFDATQLETLVGDDRWGIGATVTILEDIRRHKLALNTREGIMPNVMMLNSATLDTMVQDTGVQNAVKQTVANGADLVFIDEAMVRKMVQNLLGLTILINDEVYQEELEGPNVKYIKDNKVILFSSKVQLGTTRFGTTPESLLPPSEGQVESINGEVSVITVWENNPVSKLTIASMVCLPSGEGLNTIQVLTVA